MSRTLLKIPRAWLEKICENRSRTQVHVQYLTLPAIDNILELFEAKKASTKMIRF